MPKQSRIVSGSALLGQLKGAFKKLLETLGVSAIPARIATHFVFKYIFKPMAHHFMVKGYLNSYCTKERHPKTGKYTGKRIYHHMGDHGRLEQFYLQGLARGGK